jgi:hypothetical protein
MIDIPPQINYCYAQSACLRLPAGRQGRQAKRLAFFALNIWDQRLDSFGIRFFYEFGCSEDSLSIG